MSKNVSKKRVTAIPTVSGKVEVMKFVPGDSVRLSFDVKKVTEVFIISYDTLLDDVKSDLPF